MDTSSPACQNSQKSELPNYSSGLKDIAISDKFDIGEKNNFLSDKVIMALLCQKDSGNKPLEERAAAFGLDIETIIELIGKFSKILQERPIELKVGVVVNFFGDIHGQYLIRFLDLFFASIKGPGEI